MATSPSGSSMETSEAELMKECAPLYGSIALESLASFVMGAMFLYLYIRVSSRSELKAPAKAIWRLVRYSAKNSLLDFYDAMCNWSKAPDQTLQERFAFCRKCNKGILLFQAMVAFVSITRWLHIGNVNGFRYLGYSITCPPMQAELVLLIAPVVPCFRVVFTFTYAITFSMLILGWVASLRPEPLFDCSFESLLDFDAACFNFTFKFWVIAPSVIVQVFLTFIHIPYLGILYLYNGGGSNKMLPYGYLKLLLIVAVTWLGFPIWWFLSYEGMGVIEDTRMNAIAFAFLNVVSKGSYSFQVLSMVATTQAKSASAVDSALGLSAAARLGATRPRSGSVCSDSSMSSCSSDDFKAPPEVRAALSVTAWLVRFLRNFDDGHMPGQEASGGHMPYSSEGTASGGHMPGQEACKDLEAPDIKLKEGYLVDAEKSIPSKDRTISPSKDWTISTCASPDDSVESEKAGTQLWDALEPMYRRFLRDAGVTPACFSWMSAPEKVSLREKYDKVASAILQYRNKSSKMPSAFQRIPKWVKSAAVPLDEATDDQLMREVRRRMEGTMRELPNFATCFIHESEASDGIAESLPQKSSGFALSGGWHDPIDSKLVL